MKVCHNDKNSRTSMIGSMEVAAKLKPSKPWKTIPSPSKDEISEVVGAYTNTTEDSSFHKMSQVSSLDTRLEIVDGDSSKEATLSNSYSLEWENLFTKPGMTKTLKEKAMEGSLRSSRFRSVAWRIFLEVLLPDMSDWIERTQKSRNKYEEMKNRLIVNPRKAVDCVDITLNNPLSQDEESPWNKFFQDNELRLTIKQDVIRTYPKIEFFQSNQLRNLMVDILFIFAKENADVSYQQGMHELLAPLIFVLHCDHQAFLHACEIDTELCHRENVMKEMLDPTYLEHDAYTMFCQVMKTVEPWYLSRDWFTNQSKNGSVRSLERINAIPFSKSQDLNPSSVIVAKLTRIQDEILKTVDPELHQHLEQLEIVPHIYGIRWLRLLFGREFPMQDLLMLWDVIFGDGITFDLVDYIFVAMLLYLRDILLTSDYTVCLTVLMKFPPVSDSHYFVAKALWIREPDVYSQPSNYTHQGAIRISSSMDSSTENISNCASDGGSRGIGRSHSRHHGQSNKQQNNLLGGFSSFSRKFSRPRTLSVPKSSSEPMNLQTDVSPGGVHTGNPIGSTVSLSHVDESMFRHAHLASGLAQLESSNLRSAQSSPGLHHSTMFPLTPDDVSVTSSPPKYNSLSGKSMNQQRITKSERELQKISQLQRELNDKNSMCRYCSCKLDVHIGRLQQDLSKQSYKIDDDIMMSLAGLKLVRDILNGTVTFSQKVAGDDDEYIQTNYDYYGSHDGEGGNYSTGVTSPESDILLSVASGGDENMRLSDETRQESFFIGNDRASSPGFLTPEAIAINLDRKVSGSKNIELYDFHNIGSNVVTDSNLDNVNFEGERRLSGLKDIGFDGSGQKGLLSLGGKDSLNFGEKDSNLSFGRKDSSRFSGKDSLGFGGKDLSSGRKDSNLSFGGKDSLSFGGKDSNLSFGGKDMSFGGKDSNLSFGGKNSNLSFGGKDMSFVGKDSNLSFGGKDMSFVGKDSNLSFGGKDLPRSGGKDSSLSSGDKISLNSGGKNISNSGGKDSSNSSSFASKFLQMFRTDSSNNPHS